MTIQAVQRQTTSSEFVEWQRFFMLNKNEPTVEHHYLAQIAAEACRSRLEKPGSVKNDDFLITFKDVNEPLKPESPEELARMTARSKSAWGMALGTKI